MDFSQDFINFFGFSYYIHVPLGNLKFNSGKISVYSNITPLLILVQWVVETNLDANRTYIF